MNGILRIGFKLLVNDRGKFAALLVGIAFVGFLMVHPDFSICRHPL